MHGAVDFLMWGTHGAPALGRLRLLMFVGRSSPPGIAGRSLFHPVAFQFVRVITFCVCGNYFPLSAVHARLACACNYVDVPPMTLCGSPPCGSATGAGSLRALQLRLRQLMRLPQRTLQVQLDTSHSNTMYHRVRASSTLRPPFPRSRNTTPTRQAR